MQHYYIADIRPLYNSVSIQLHLNECFLFIWGFRFLNNDRNKWVKEFFLKVGGKPCRGLRKHNKVAKIAVGKKLYMENYRILMKD